MFEGGILLIPTSTVLCLEVDLILMLLGERALCEKQSWNNIRLREGEERRGLQSSY